MKFLKLMGSLSIGKLMVLAIFMTVGYYLTYFNDGTLLEQQITALESQVAEETARRVGIEKIIKKEEEMRGNLLQLERNLEVVKAKIPVEFKDTEMSYLLNSTARDSGVNILELSTSPIVFEKNIDPRSIRPEDLIDEIKFSITLVGRYEAFLNFLDILSKEDKVIRVRNFSIDKNSTNIDDDLIKFKGEVVGFKQSQILINSSQSKK